MSRIIITVLLFAFLMNVVQSEKYTTKYDHLDIDAIIRNTRIFNSYLKCILDQGRCSADGMELKRILPDALTTDCQSCSPKQKEGATKVINHLMAHRPDVWKSLTAKYDPRGIYYMRLKQRG